MPWQKPPLIRNQPTRPPILAGIPEPVSLPANAPSRAIQLMKIDPLYPDAKIDRLRRTAAWIASRYGVRLHFPPLGNLVHSDWEDIGDIDIPAIRDYGQTHDNHVVLLVRTITTTYMGELKPRGGLGGSRYSVVAAVSCENVLAHEIGHAAGLQHRESATNVMMGSSCAVGDVNLDADQAASLREWAARPATARMRELDVPFVCG